MKCKLSSKTVYAGDLGRTDMPADFPVSLSTKTVGRGREKGLREKVINDIVWNMVKWDLVPDNNLGLKTQPKWFESSQAMVDGRIRVKHLRRILWMLNESLRRLAYWDSKTINVIIARTVDGLIHGSKDVWKKVKKEAARTTLNKQKQSMLPMQYPTAIYGSDLSAETKNEFNKAYVLSTCEWAHKIDNMRLTPEWVAKNLAHFPFEISVDDAVAFYEFNKEMNRLMDAPYKKNQYATAFGSYPIAWREDAETLEENELKLESSDDEIMAIGVAMAHEGKGIKGMMICDETLPPNTIVVDERNIKFTGCKKDFMALVVGTHKYTLGLASKKTIDNIERWTSSDCDGDTLTLHVITEEMKARNAEMLKKIWGIDPEYVECGAAAFRVPIGSSSEVMGLTVIDENGNKHKPFSWTQDISQTPERTLDDEDPMKLEIDLSKPKNEALRELAHQLIDIHSGLTIGGVDLVQQCLSLTNGFDDPKLIKDLGYIKHKVIDNRPVSKDEKDLVAYGYKLIDKYGKPEVFPKKLLAYEMAEKCKLTKFLNGFDKIQDELELAKYTDTNMEAKPPFDVNAFDITPEGEDLWAFIWESRSNTIRNVIEIKKDPELTSDDKDKEIRNEFRALTDEILDYVEALDNPLDVIGSMMRIAWSEKPDKGKVKWWNDEGVRTRNTFFITILGRYIGDIQSRFAVDVDESYVPDGFIDVRGFKGQVSDLQGVELEVHAKPERIYRKSDWYSVELHKDGKQAGWYVSKEEAVLNMVGQKVVL